MISITFEKRMLLNKIIARKNQDISWLEATNKINDTGTVDENTILAEQAKAVYFENLEQEQYLHSLS